MSDNAVKATVFGAICLLGCVYKVCETVVAVYGPSWGC